MKKTLYYIDHFGRLYSYTPAALRAVLVQAIAEDGAIDLDDRRQLKRTPACITSFRDEDTDEDDEEFSSGRRHFHSSDPTKKVIRLLDTEVADQQRLRDELLEERDEADEDAERGK